MKAIVNIEFNGHRKEPNLQLKIDLATVMETGRGEFHMTFNPQSRKWELVVQYDNNKEVVGLTEFK